MIDTTLKTGDLALFDGLVVKVLGLVEDKDTWCAELEDLATGEDFWVGFYKHRTSKKEPFSLIKHIHTTL